MTCGRAQAPKIAKVTELADTFNSHRHHKYFKLNSRTTRAASEELLFRFALPVRGGSYAIEKVDFSNIYPLGSVEDIDLATLRELVAKLPCCTTNKSGTDYGDPLNIVVAGQGLDALFSFIGRGWRLNEPFDLHSVYRTILAFLFRSEYLNAPISLLHVFGRQQDFALQKALLWFAKFAAEFQTSPASGLTKPQFSLSKQR